MRKILSRIFGDLWSRSFSRDTHKDIFREIEVSETK